MSTNSNYANNIFKYNNRRYSFFATLMTETGDESTNIIVSLDMADLVEFSYESQMNDLLITGHIDYIDKYGQVDRFLNQHFSYCYIQFGEMKEKSDGGIVIEKIDEDTQFQHIFLISSISIIERNLNIIKYRIQLISKNWFNCMANVKFSNYDKEQQSLFDIFKACLMKSELNIDKDTFDRVNTTVKMNYSTAANDNMFSISKYLFRRLYYFSQKDDSMKYFVYDAFSNIYKLVDIRDKETLTGTYTTIISFFKTNLEGLLQKDPTRMGYFANPQKKEDLYQTMFTHKMDSYDHEKNEFSTVTTSNESTTNFMNSRLDLQNYEQKYEKMFDTTLGFCNYGSYWNNDNHQYENIAISLAQSNSVIFDVAGEIFRKPASALMVNLDRTLKDVSSDDKQDLKKLKEKYRAYEGVWFVSKVKTIVHPNEQVFRQQLVAFRNYIPTVKAQ